MRVRDAGDVNLLQETLRRLHHWCCKNAMSLNLDKCKAMTLHTNKNPILASYNINNVSLSRVESIKDLGVTFEPNLKFNLHYNNIKNKSLKMLGLLYRHTQDFRNPTTLKNLYYSYVLPNLEYCCTVWSPQYETDIKFLESVQHKFLRMLAFKTYTRILDHNYEDIMTKNNIISLKKRRDMQDLIFLHKILNAQIYSPEILSKINLKTKGRATRSTDIFALRTNKTNLGEHAPIHRMLKIGNIASGVGLDMFHSSVGQIKDYFFNT
uniref:Reverse transcriptase domain-containing protein n=1 Tax=Cacopsylla melanoneura TaxID=428564 RepID=A0A8D8ZS18_9HEMI